MPMNQAADIDAFIANFPPETQAVLQRLRAMVREEAPEATETISYGIPTFVLNGNLVHFSAYAHHIGFYPGAEGIAVFQGELAGYKTSKGTVQFALDQPIPYDLIRRIVQYRVEKNRGKAAKKAKK